jgi:glycine oxidase
MASKIAIIGCGAIGAMIAYELSKVADLQVTVLEAESQPAQSATGAALGILMAASGHKLRGKLVTLRLASLCLFDRLVAELAIATTQEIPYHQGILSLFDNSEAEARCKSLIPHRAARGFPMHWLDRDELSVQYPQFQACGGLYSSSDRAIHPSKFVQSLVFAAQKNGVTFHWNCLISSLEDLPQDLSKSDWIVVTAGLGANALLAPMLQKSEELLEPIGGQAIAVHAPDLNLQTVIHAEASAGIDINIVPLENDRYWIGATLEFDATYTDHHLPTAANVSLLLDHAIAFCPEFAKAKVMETWAGDRPHPKAHKSPILGFLPNHPNVLLAIGHYRNGVLMAPITAQITRDLILHGKSDLPWQRFSL